MEGLYGEGRDWLSGWGVGSCVEDGEGEVGVGGGWCGGYWVGEVEDVGVAALGGSAGSGDCSG